MFQPGEGSRSHLLFFSFYAYSRSRCQTFWQSALSPIPAPSQKRLKDKEKQSFFFLVHEEFVEYFWKIYSLQCYSADIWYLPSVVCGFFLFLVPVWVIIASRSPQIREVLKSGWQPVILAMSISRWGDLSQITVSLPFQCRSPIGATHMYRVFSSSPVLVVWFWIKLWAIQTLRVWQCLLQSSMVSKRRTSQCRYVQKKNDIYPFLLNFPCRAFMQTVNKWGIIRFEMHILNLIMQHLLTL